MTKLLVRFFGSVTDVTGTSQEVITEPIANIGELLEHLALKHPGLNGLIFQVSINQEIRSDNPKLESGDEVALLPPFAGG